MHGVRLALELTTYDKVGESISVQPTILETKIGAKIHEMRGDFLAKEASSFMAAANGKAYAGKALYKSEIAENYGVDIRVIKSMLKNHKDELPQLFNRTKKKVSSNEIEKLIRLFGFGKFF
jgi:hypothetical protein